MMIENIFVELGLIILVAILVSLIMRWLKQPLIIGYIITGIIISPYFLNIITERNSIAGFAQIGVAFLLFLVGLNLNPRVIKEVGKVSLITGFGQVLFTSILGFFLCLIVGFSYLQSIYISIALSFSSTIIIMKLLSDKGDMQSLYGRISIGFLIVQDLIAIAVLMFISSLSPGGNIGSFIIQTALKGGGLILFLVGIGRYVLPKMTKAIARSQEFLLLFSIGWCLTLAAMFYYFGFSIEIGALLAGFTLSFSDYRYEISSKMKPLRDFFIVLFFILLGSQMVFANIGQYLWPLIVLSLFVLLGNPFVVMIIMGIMGYTKKNSFYAGLTVAQISEFSLILVALGVKVGHLSNELLSFVTIIALVTIAGSTYFILYSNKMYLYIGKYLSIFERKGAKVDEHRYHKEKSYDILLFGYDHLGFDILESFKKIHKKYLIIDYNPETIIKLAKEGVECLYGDASDLELLNELDFSKAKMVISTIRDLETDLLLIKKARESNKRIIIIAMSYQIDQSLTLYNAGATYVIMPHFLGAHHTATMIEGYGLNLSKFVKEKATHIAHLNERKRLGHEHPAVG